jgi:hypothetical protein
MAPVNVKKKKENLLSYLQFVGVLRQKKNHIILWFE